MTKTGTAPDPMTAEARRNIQHTLRQMTPRGAHSRIPRRRSSWLSLLIYAIVILALCSTYVLSKLQFFEAGTTLEAYGERALLCGLLALVLLASEKLIRLSLIAKIPDDITRYNMAQVVRFFIWLAIGTVTVSTLFSNWTTTLVSLGVISLVLGLALQAPLTNLFAWFYILIRAPYRVGDRIKIGGAAGDVINVGFLDTTLWEFGGEYLTTDHPSGRVIKFPNSLVFSTAVYNYSWPLFPYLWNEIRLYVAYQSDLEFVAQVMREEARAEIGDEMREHVATYRALIVKTPVDEIEVTEEPRVFFRAADNGHIAAIVRYVVPPKRAGHVQTALIKRMLQKLNEHPNRVLFPKP